MLWKNIDIWSDSYKDISLFFAILFFIVKCVLISVKYLIKFGSKYVWIYLFQHVMWRLTNYLLIKNKNKNLVTKTTHEMSL